MNLLFVCTKNIARSPLAEAICRDLAAEAAAPRTAASAASAAASGAGPAPAAVPRLDVRSAGIASSAARRLTTRDMAWADVVAVMEPEHLEHIRRHWPDHAAKVRVLDVPDDYVPDEPELRELLTAKVRALLEDLGRS